MNRKTRRKMQRAQPRKPRTEHVAGLQGIAPLISTMKAAGFGCCPACSGTITDDAEGRLANDRIEILCAHCGRWTDTLKSPRGLTAGLCAVVEEVPPELLETASEPDEPKGEGGRPEPSDEMRRRKRNSRASDPTLAPRLDPELWAPDFMWKLSADCGEEPDGTELRFSVLRPYMVGTFSDAMKGRHVSLVQDAEAALDAEPAMTIAMVLGLGWANALYALALGADNPVEWMQDVAAVALLRLEVAAIMAMGFSCPSCGSRMPDDPRTQIISGKLQFMCPHCNAWVPSLHQVPGDTAAIVAELTGELRPPPTQAFVEAEDDVA